MLLKLECRLKEDVGGSIKHSICSEKYNRKLGTPHQCVVILALIGLKICMQYSQVHFRIRLVCHLFKRDIRAQVRVGWVRNKGSRDTERQY